MRDYRKLTGVAVCAGCLGGLGYACAQEVPREARRSRNDHPPRNGALAEEIQKALPTVAEPDDREPSQIDVAESVDYTRLNSSSS